MATASLFEVGVGYADDMLQLLHCAVDSSRLAGQGDSRSLEETLLGQYYS